MVDICGIKLGDLEVSRVWDVFTEMEGAYLRRIAGNAAPSVAGDGDEFLSYAFSSFYFFWYFFS